MAAKKKASKEGSKKEEKLGFKPTSAWDGMTKRTQNKMNKVAQEYIKFLDAGKTEREAVVYLTALLEKNGFKPLDKVKRLSVGTRVYTTNRGKNLAAVIIGSEPLENGLNIVASHVDAPRLDLKQNPLYESGDLGLALLRTHYYGGIKKYQWASIPLALHGTVILASGKTVDIVIGEKDEDPVFTITDLLPHLSGKKQNVRKLPDGIRGEELQVLVGSMPINDEKAKKKVKLFVLDYLNKNYGMVEEDFVSAELEIVPAYKAREVGLDRSLVGAYGQDDRICAFTSVMALLDVKKPKRTAMALLFDKEEIGSDGPTGVKSKYLMNTIGDLMEKKNPNYRDAGLRRSLELSMALSADVNAGVNPIFKDVHEMQNAAKIGYGIVITKFTGSGGKYMSNDATAEFVGKVRKLYNSKKVPWQAAELGKVDEGGGGTVAKFLAQHNMDVLDCGPAILAMHSPFEISSKVDIFACVNAYNAFYELK